MTIFSEFFGTCICCNTAAAGVGDAGGGGSGGLSNLESFRSRSRNLSLFGHFSVKRDPEQYSKRPTARTLATLLAVGRGTCLYLGHGLVSLVSKDT